MATYVFSYRNGKGYAATAESRALWMAWFDSMGDALVDMGKPVSARAGIGDCDSRTTEFGGYSLIDAPDLAAALAIAKGCPGLSRAGGVEVGVLVDVADLAALTGAGLPGA